MSNDDQFGLAVLGCIGVLAVIPLAAILDGYALATMWGWFVMPVFHLPALTIPYAIGISMVTSLVAHSGGSARKFDNWYDPLMTALVRPMLALGCGAIVRMWL